MMSFCVIKTKAYLNAFKTMMSSINGFKTCINIVSLTLELRMLHICDARGRALSAAVAFLRQSS